MDWKNMTNDEIMGYYLRMKEETKVYLNNLLNKDSKIDYNTCRNKLSYYRIDKRLRKMIYLLNNKIRFTSTGPEDKGYCCQGHLKEEIEFCGETIVSDPGHIFMTSGAVLIVIDEDYPESQDFEADLKQLADKYDFAKLEKREKKDEPNKHLIALSVEISDLVTDENAVIGNSSAEYIKKRNQTRIGAAAVRLIHFHKVWNELETIVDDYAENNPTSSS